MKKLERDVVIVGSGPGGSTCSAFLKRYGIDALLLDKEIFPRDKTCGDCQTGESTRALKELGWLDGFREIGYEVRGLRLISPDGTSVRSLTSVPHMWYNTPRRIYDDYLRRMAIKDGVEMKENAWVYDVILENGKVCGVKAKIDGEYCEIRSKIVIGADGAHSIIARKVGMYPDITEHVDVVGRCYYEDVHLQEDDITEIYFDKDVLPGYVWLFPEKDHICNVGLGFPRSQYNQGMETLVQTLDRWIETSPNGACLRGKKRVGEFKGWRIAQGCQRMDNYGDGFMLIGDAGSMIVPLTGEGQGTAISTGKFAAMTCRDAFAANDFSAATLKHYKELTDEKYDQRFKDIRAMHAAFSDEAAINATFKTTFADQAVLDEFMEAQFFNVRGD